MKDFVLWGCHRSHCDGQPLKIMGGTLRECQTALKQRMTENWTDLDIRLSEVAPPNPKTCSLVEAQDYARSKGCIINRRGSIHYWLSRANES